MIVNQVLAMMEKSKRWGRITCLGIERKDRVNADGTEILANQPYLVLQCDCGTPAFEVWASDFPGKRKMLDCGRCGLGIAHKMPMVQAISMRLDTRLLIEAFQNKYGWNTSQTVVELVRQGAECKTKHDRPEITEDELKAMLKELLTEQVSRYAPMKIEANQIHRTIQYGQLAKGLMAKLDIRSKSDLGETVPLV